jgi:hypothetical protein
MVLVIDDERESSEALAEFLGVQGLYGLMCS